jgi:hypothetical protein
MKKRYVLVSACVLVTLLLGLAGCQPGSAQSPIPTRASPLQTPPSPTVEVEPTAASDAWPTLTPPTPLPTRPPLRLSPTPVGSPPADLQSLYYGRRARTAYHRDRRAEQKMVGIHC